VLDEPNAFRGIYVLPPGSAWIFQGGALKNKATYFETEGMGRTRRLSPGHITLFSRDAFVRNLPVIFNGQERVGVSLTGGLDTRIIMAWQKPAPPDQSLATRSAVCIGQPGCDLSAQSSQICGQSLK